MGKNKLLVTLAAVIFVGIALGLVYLQLDRNQTSQAPSAEASALPVTPNAEVSALPSDTPSDAPTGPQASNPNPDLTVDANGLSKATISINTVHGVIRFKFYPVEAPQTVKRIITLINQGFYNGLTFHRVVPGFVVQGGDPQGTGTGGSGQNLKAEFNSRRHVEGTVAMARAADPDSADSQFYIALGPQPHLDQKYTVFGQVIEGMDAVRKIQIGDKMNSVTIE